MSTLKYKIRSLVPNNAVNLGKHLPTAIAANLKYGFPSRGMTVIGVTGTDGKTTTVNMIYQILKAAGKKVAMVSTVKAIINDQEIDTGFHVTSPTHQDMQRYIRRAHDAGSEFLVLEVSSFALSQYRVWGIKFDTGVITNITRDHLDYHKTWENYFQAKAMLIKNSRVAVINHDEDHFKRLKQLATGQVASFGFDKSADFNPKNTPLKLQVLGEFNLANALAAYAATINLGIDPKVITQALSDFQSVSGRMEVYPTKKPFQILIDYAHTANGVEKALTAMRTKTKNRLIVVTGAEGYRDDGKRYPIGQTAAKLADVVIITAVDPRGLIKEINQEMLRGAINGGGVENQTVFVIEDRQSAINKAIEIAKIGDTVALLGKGHENSMNLDGRHEIPWSDHQAVKKALNGSSKKDKIQS